MTFDLRGAPVLLGLVLFAGPVLAQQPSQAQISAIKSACRGDYRASAPSCPPGGRQRCSACNSTAPRSRRGVPAHWRRSAGRRPGARDSAAGRTAAAGTPWHRCRRPGRCRRARNSVCCGPIAVPTTAVLPRRATRRRARARLPARARPATEPPMPRGIAGGSATLTTEGFS